MARKRDQPSNIILLLTERRVKARLALKATAHAASRGGGGRAAVLLLPVVTRVGGGAAENGSSSWPNSPDRSGRLLSMSAVF